MQNKRILLIAVNYNTYKELYAFLKSIDESFSQIDKRISLDIIVADNSFPPKSFNYSFEKITYKVINFENLGYLGAAFYIINNYVNTIEYDYIIISNVDLIVSHDFFKNLIGIVPSQDLAWISPSIISIRENRDKNPKIVQRYTKFKIYFLYLMYKIPLLHHIYQNSLYKRKKKKKESSQKRIYAGHGSFMIFTKIFFTQYSKIEYPIFLFGEELFFAELIRRKSLYVEYFPNIKVYDDEHISTSKMNSKFYYKCNREAIKYIISNFYE